MFGANCVYRPELLASLIEAFPQCCYEFKKNDSVVLTGGNAVVNAIMNSQVNFDEKVGWAFGNRNANFLNRLLGRIALHMVHNTMCLPNTLLTKYYLYNEFIDSQVLQMPDLDSRHLHYVGLKIDLARNMQILLREFFKFNDVIRNSKVHPFYVRETDFYADPKTVIKRKIDRDSKLFIVDNFTDAAKYENVMIVNEFFILWPFYRLSLRIMRKRVDYEERLVGTAGDTLRELVKSFGMHELGYPVHMSGEKYLK